MLMSEWREVAIGELLDEFPSSRLKLLESKRLQLRPGAQVCINPPLLDHIDGWRILHRLGAVLDWCLKGGSDRTPFTLISRPLCFRALRQTSAEGDLRRL